MAAGENYHDLMLPANVHLKAVLAWNSTTGFFTITICIAPTNAPTPTSPYLTGGNHIPLIGKPQGGKNEPVAWHGDLIVDPKFRRIRVITQDALNNDVLRIWAVTEP